MQERLQKLIARAGIASRRHAEQMILSGAVTVNGRVVTELGSKADAERDHIKVHGKLLQFGARKRYLALHKPAGCVATMHDPERRQDLSHWLRNVRERVFPIGRLDYHADGLLLLTNDGELADQVLKAAGLPQVYWLKLKGRLDAAEQENISKRAGAVLRPLRHQSTDAKTGNVWYEVRLAGARDDRLRRALFASGHPVSKLRRVAIGPIALGSLAAGKWRELSPEEVIALRREAAGKRSRPKRNNHED